MATESTARFMEITRLFLWGRKSPSEPVVEEAAEIIQPVANQPVASQTIASQAVASLAVASLAVAILARQRHF